MTVSRNDLHTRIDHLSDDQLEPAAALLDEELPPGRGSTGEDQVAVQRRYAAQHNPRALDFGPNLTGTPLPLGLSSARDVLEGQVAFDGTRIPVWVLFNYLADERALAAFREAYPQVPVETLVAALDQACLVLTGQTSQGDTPRRRRRAG